jgi:hypothetical protein
MGRACGTNGWGGGIVLRALVGNPEGKRHGGRSRHRWEDNVTIDLTDMSARIILGEGGKGRPAHKTDNLTAICEPTV